MQECAWTTESDGPCWSLKVQSASYRYAPGGPFLALFISLSLSIYPCGVGICTIGHLWSASIELIHRYRCPIILRSCNVIRTLGLVWSFATWDISLLTMHNIQMSWKRSWNWSSMTVCCGIRVKSSCRPRVWIFPAAISQNGVSKQDIDLFYNFSRFTHDTRKEHTTVLYGELFSVGDL